MDVTGTPTRAGPPPMSTIAATAVAHLRSSLSPGARVLTGDDDLATLTARDFSLKRTMDQLASQVVAQVPARLVQAGAITVRLACRAPFDGDAMFAFLAARAVPRG